MSRGLTTDVKALLDVLGCLKPAPHYRTMASIAADQAGGKTKCAAKVRHAIHQLRARGWLCAQFCATDEGGHRSTGYALRPDRDREARDYYRDMLTAHADYRGPEPEESPGDVAESA
jgi:hypothetical protein